MGEGGLAAGEAARFLYGAAIVLVILFEPAGLAGLGRRFRRRGRDPGGGTGHRAATSPTTPTTTSRPTDQHKGARHESRQAFARRRSSSPPCLLAAASGCSNKAQDTRVSGGGGDAGDVTTDVGIEGKTINSASSPT